MHSRDFVWSLKVGRYVFLIKGPTEIEHRTYLCFIFLHLIVMCQAGVKLHFVKFISVPRSWARRNTDTKSSISSFWTPQTRKAKGLKAIWYWKYKEYAYIYIHIYMSYESYIHVCLYVCPSVCLDVCMSVCLCVCMSLCLHVSMSLCLYVSMMSVCLYVCMYGCMYVRTYVRT